MPFKMSADKGVQKGMRTFVIVDAALDTSACSSLTDGSDMSWDNGSLENEFVHGQKNDPKLDGENADPYLKQSKADSIPYAQLFFDPETQMLVTLMEVNFVNNSDLDYGSNNGEMYLKNAPKEAETSPIMIQSMQEESRCLDETMLTEFSNSSSEIERDGPEWNPVDYSSQRFSDEPIVFSHHHTRHLWLEDSDLDLYLLEECADPWDASIRKSAGCTEALKNLLKLRACVSLALVRPVGESKWKSSHNGKTPVTGTTTPTMAYCALRDI